MMPINAKKIYDKIRVYDVNGEDMIVSLLDPEKI